PPAAAPRSARRSKGVACSATAPRRFSSGGRALHTFEEAFREMRALLPQQLKVDHLGPLTIPLHALHAMGLRYGEDQFAQKGACFATFLIAIRTDVLWLQSETFGPWEVRALIYKFINQFLHQSNAHAYTFLSEAFTTA